MDKVLVEQIFEAIKKDDEQAFVSFVVRKNLQNISFGRFPILSVCYLFESTKILSKYEKHLARIGKFDIVDELYEIYLKFKTKAKKSLRLFLNEDSFCYPIEMLGILDRREHIAKIYKFLFKNEQILLNLTKIYNLNKQIEINATAEKFVCESKKMNKTQKFWLASTFALIILFSLFSFLSVIVVSGKFGLGTQKLPILINSSDELALALDKGTKYYKIEQDISLENELNISEFKGQLDGGNHTLTLNNSESLFDSLSGTIKNLTIKTQKQTRTIKTNYGIIAKNITGKLQNIKLFAEIDSKVDSKSDIYVAGFAVENKGEILDSTIVVDINLENSEPINAFVAGFVGINSGTVLNCKTEGGKILTDTVDVAGIVFENLGTIENCENNATIYQTSGEAWNPNCAGIVANNYANVLNSINNAKIEAVSSAENYVKDANGNDLMVETYVAGIACQNSGSISKSQNTGEIVATAKLSTIYAGGLASINTFQEVESQLVTGVVQNSKSICKVTATGENSKCVVGGLVAYNVANVKNCGSETIIKTDASGVAGALVGRHGFIYNVSGQIAYIGIIQNNYSNSSFERNDISIEQNAYKFGAIVGSADYYMYLPRFINSNHYVFSDTYNGVMYLSDNSIITEVSTFGCFVYNTFIEIPSEVKNVF